VIEVRRSADRFETVQPGITTRHCFSSGAHYDPDNLAFGALLAVDEHTVAPGAGFARHAHRGVDILTWVLAGTLRHEDESGHPLLVAPGTALHQSAGSGIEHTEVNASAAEPLRFVQLWLLGGVADPHSEFAALPLPVEDGTVALLSPTAPTALAPVGHLHLFVTRGTLRAAGTALERGDSVRVRDEAVLVEGDGDALMWRSGAAAPSLQSRP
jgi:quercetin dioxygenase-like cupin family protein